ncbi:MAG: aquaporin family protein [Oligoflexales bacterium]|nr:aquaporin family protein [Oligoflexales bacterium]
MTIEYFAEFIGTALLVLLGNGSVANATLKQTKGQNAGMFFIAAGWGLAVFIGVVISQKYSGAHLNPAVTLGLAFSGLFPWEKVAPFILVQILGGAFGSLLVWTQYRDHFNRTEDQSSILGCFSTVPAIRNIPVNLFSEFIGTFVLMLTIFNIKDPEFLFDEASAKIGMGSLGALPVALLVTSIGISLGGTTGYAINPARDLGPRIMHALLPIKLKGDSDWSYSWVPIAGPILGAIAAYAVMKIWDPISIISL